MQIEEVSLVNDMIQDSRAAARAEYAYNVLTEQIIRNSKLNWDKTGLILKSDEKLFDLIEALEPIKYNNKLKELQSLEENKKEE